MPPTAWPSPTTASPVARQALAQWLEPQAPDGLLVYRTELVLEEILMNLVWHAWPAGETGRFSVECERVGDDVMLRFEDDGRPFDPTSAPAIEPAGDVAHARIGGLGLHLVKQFARALHYERRGDRNRLTVLLAA